ncbi:MAG: hypothetical protein A3G18_12005 [Rhodospirillales bacterium RIFCSPLOWO2_12_FULL_58_28]|nr:MAG: hypothetical protein A3H92_09090 [Rhodospirillales bacterium RIFCSPLOWO2_02_FULL_58_16]OHC78165.1 MAG: hypothetical protein A3G18_12005 [Rhodospirillales bacterium RIFCSPLOWO2_12_FULL_58_28]
MRIFAFAVMALLLTVGVARAETFPVVTDKTVIKECGECHMVFPPQTLPKASWEKIMATLSDHFGENAVMDPAAAANILAFHVANSSDVSDVRAAVKWRVRETLARITDAPRFVSKHKQCGPEVWAHKQVRSKANCLACHPTMNVNGSTDAKMKFLPAELQRKCGEGDD